MSDRPVINMAEVPLTARGHGERFAVRWGRAGPRLGLTGLGCAVHVVPPGKRAFPFHRHHVMDELFLIVSGEGEYRFGEESFPLRAGDIVGAPAGTNTGTEELRYLGISSMGGADIVDYPDSGKVALAAGIKNGDFKTATYAGVGRIASADYWDGEGA